MIDLRVPPGPVPQSQGMFLVPVLPPIGVTTFGFTGNTTLRLSMVQVATETVARALLISVSAVSVAGTLRLALFSGDGDRKLLDILTPNITGAGAVAVPLQHLLPLIADSYYLAVLPQGTASITLSTWSVVHPAGLVLPTGEPALHATATVGASTMPDQISQGTLTVATDASIPIVRVLPVARAMP